ncbi:hypothetical protein C048_01111 [Brucella melitensis UK19/04]|nr:hypothetical protein C048_01111 [Brucella melitensis UK19/04]
MAPFLSPPKIQEEERQQRLALLQGKLKDRHIGGLLLGSTPSLQYFTGLVWRSSERFLGALVTPSELIYIVPGFERSRVESLPHLSGEIRGWEEEENSAALIASLLPAGASLAVDDAIPLFAYNLLRQEIAPERLLDGGHCRRADIGIILAHILPSTEIDPQADGNRDDRPYDKQNPT